MVQVLPQFDPWGEAGRDIVQGFNERMSQRIDDLSLQNALQKLPEKASAEDVMKAILGTHASPQAKQQAYSNFIQARSSDTKLPENQPTDPLALQKMGFNDEEIEVYQRGNRGVKDALMRSVLARKERQQPEQQALSQTNQEIRQAAPQAQAAEQQAPGGEQAVSQAMQPQVQQPIAGEAPEFEWAPPPIVPESTAKERVQFFKEREKNNNRQLLDVRKKIDNSKITQAKLTILENLSDKLPENYGRLVINPFTGEPYSIASLTQMGVSKETQQFVKTVNDFLSEAKDFFGGRVSNFEVQSFKSRLPTLLNSSEGRRAIIKQMQLIDEYKNAYYESLNESISHYGGNAPFSFLSKEAERHAQNREKDLLMQIDNLDEGTRLLDVREKTPALKGMTLFQNREGKFKFVPPNLVESAEREKWLKW